jgi:exosortase D (VPLPA-CTERM-specific)
MSIPYPQPHYLKTDYRTWVLVSLVLAIAVGLFYDGLRYVVDTWFGREEYSHGILIPMISAFLIWQKKNELAGIPFKGSWLGLVALVLGLALFFLGEMATLFVIVQYAFLVVLFALVLAIMGPQVFREIQVPLFLLFFTIPLPEFLYNGLSTKLQLISSELGVYFIRAFGISVYLEGNVIDLGSMQLQVVEACNGLRYLFPLMSLAFICAYFYQAALWKRAVIFVSSIPITVLMNSFRIGLIGVTVEYWGKDMAEGFLHDFEGWFIFMVCTGILILEMWVLAQIGKERRSLMEVFGLTFPEPLPKDAVFKERVLPKQYWVALGLLLTALGGSLALDRREDIVPPRSEFSAFPLSVADWKGRREIMEQQYIDALKFDDYILANYVNSQGSGSVNFYSAYYASQRKGESVHSPRSCIPGGGWQIAAHDIVDLNGLAVGGQPLKVNRLLIQKGEDRQLVYYWFQQRGRDLTNEYVVKWYLFWDALTRNRTDGALVRLTTFAPKGEDLAMADRRLREFVGTILPDLDRFIPR